MVGIFTDPKVVEEENADLMLLANLLRPTSLNEALQRKIWFMNMDLRTAHRNMSFLNGYFNSRFHNGKATENQIETFLDHILVN